MKYFGNHVNLVVCQKSKLDDWLQHFTEHYEMQVFDLTKQKSLDDFCALAMGDRYNIVGVINYDLLWRRKDLLHLTNFTLMLDESSLIQNSSSKRTKFVLKLQPRNVILLSGTPCSGKYENLYSQIHLLGWNITEQVYNTHYVNWKDIRVGGFVHKIVDKDEPYKNVDRLKQKMREHGCHFLKTDEVFDLPKQNFQIINVPVTKEYKRFTKHHLVTVDGTEFVGDSTLSFRLYQRQLCSAYNPNKVEAFRDLLESTQDRLIVFYQFNCEASALIRVANECERPWCIVNGKEKNLASYENYDNSITFVQYQAGAMGLNLQKANKIVYFSLTEQSELFEQSKKRIHRIGQNKPCFYYLLVCRDSIEDSEILPTLNIRRELTDELFEERMGEHD
jgi:SNF2 family DNA or RNA helicase